MSMNVQDLGARCTLVVTASMAGVLTPATAQPQPRRRFKESRDIIVPQPPGHPSQLSSAPSQTWNLKGVPVLHGNFRFKIDVSTWIRRGRFDKARPGSSESRQSILDAMIVHEMQP